MKFYLYDMDMNQCKQYFVYSMNCRIHYPHHILEHMHIIQSHNLFRILVQGLYHLIKHVKQLLTSLHSPRTRQALLYCPPGHIQSLIFYLRTTVNDFCQWHNIIDFEIKNFIDQNKKPKQHFQCEEWMSKTSLSKLIICCIRMKFFRYCIYHTVSQILYKYSISNSQILYLINIVIEVGI